MANSREKKTGTAKEKAPASAKAKVNETKTTESIKETSPEVKAEKKLVPKEVDLSQYITVRNGFQGKLVYKSSRTGEKFIWDRFGDEQEIELLELRNAKNSSKKFFINNWFMFDDDWVIEYLGMRQFYKNAIKLDEFDAVFEKNAEELQEIIEGMSEGQKKSLAYRARELVVLGEIDSLKMIAMLEKHLGIELIEK